MESPSEYSPECSNEYHGYLTDPSHKQFVDKEHLDHFKEDGKVVVFVHVPVEGEGEGVGENVGKHTLNVSILPIAVPKGDYDTIIKAIRGHKCFREFKNLLISSYNFRLLKGPRVFQNGEIIWVNHVEADIGWRVLCREYADPRLCGWCFKAAESGCGKCGVRYCSRDCQLRDWGGHRRVCHIGAGIRADEEAGSDGVIVYAETRNILRGFLNDGSGF